MGKRSSLKRINSIRLDDSSTLLEYVTNNVPNTVVTLTYGADILWANQKEKRIPLLRFHVISSGGLHGQYGDYILINFPGGWDKETNVQYFGWGGSMNSSDDVSFNKVDARGYMGITTTHHEYSVENTAAEQEFHWDGGKFSKIAANK